MHRLTNDTGQIKTFILDVVNFAVLTPLFVFNPASLGNYVKRDGFAVGDFLTLLNTPLYI